MKYFMEPDYNSLSRRVCDILLDTIRRNPKAVIVLPTGHSPLGAYRLFVKKAREEELRLDEITWVQLDEWAGLSADNPSSCGYFLRKELLEPLSIEPSYFIEFHGEAPDLEEECKRVSERIKAAGKISLMMLGVGKNGHIGLNEPENVWHMSVHPVKLSQKSMTHLMLAHELEKPTQGLTIGMELLFQAEEILLIATGSDKKEAIAFLFKDIVSPHCPVSILKLHANAICVMEKETYQEAVEVNIV